MPTWLHTKLELEDQKSAENAPTLVPALVSLLKRDDSIEKAYLCHPSVRYIGKIKGEGNHFCGYRNIQMLMTYLMDVRPDPLPRLKGRIPSVLGIQDMIEDGWARGMNAYGLIQTGGIRGTRKHIGTPEVINAFHRLNLFSIPPIVGLCRHQYPHLTSDRLRHYFAPKPSTSKAPASKPSKAAKNPTYSCSTT